MAVAKKSSHHYQLWLLFIAGTLCALCEGFDGIVSLLVLYFTTPGVFVCLIGLLFAVISSVIYYSVDLVNMAKNFGMNIGPARGMLDKVISQIDKIQAQCALLEKKMFETISSDVLRTYRSQAEDLLQRYDTLKTIRTTYHKALTHPFLKGMKYLMTFVTGLLFFGNGFFAGQALVLFFFPASLMSWPALLFCGLVGCSSSWVHWMIDGPDIENIVSTWFGFDKEKLQQLLDVDVVRTTYGRLTGLIKCIGHQQKICSENEKLKTDLAHVTKGGRGRRFFDSEGLIKEFENIEPRAPISSKGPAIV